MCNINSSFESFFTTHNIMKVLKIIKFKLRYIIILCVLLTSSYFFTACSQLYITSTAMDSIGCDEHNKSDLCNKNKGDISLLKKKSLDVVLVLNNLKDHQELNSHVTTNLNKFLQCIDDVVDWKIGIVSSVYDSDFPGNYFGNFMDLEIPTQTQAIAPTDNENLYIYDEEQFVINKDVDAINPSEAPVVVHKSNPLIQNEASFLSNNILTRDVKNYEMIFSNTISLESGCENPPYCLEDGKNQPLKSVKNFMEKQLNNKNKFNNFLREYAFLAVIVLSPTDEDTSFFSSTDVKSQNLSEFFNANYSYDKFMALTVTNSYKKDDCLLTGDEAISHSMNVVTSAAAIYGIISSNPLVTILISLVDDFFNTNTDSSEIIKFTKQTKGYAFDICKPSFGNSLAYSVLQKMQQEDRFSDKCKQLKEQVINIDTKIIQNKTNHLSNYLKMAR